MMLDHKRCAIACGEALSTLQTWPDKHFDMILTDPPYSEHVHKKLGKERRNDGHAARAELTFPPLTLEDIDNLAKQFVRLSKGWIVVFTDYYLSAAWGSAIQRAGGMWVRTGIWVKTNPMPQITGDRPSTGHEEIVIGHAEGKNIEWHGGGHAAVWRGPVDRMDRAAGTRHPNQKPAWLVQALLGSFAPEGGLVLDPFVGSGTTAFAAIVKERLSGEAPVETACKACAQKIAKSWEPPIPNNLRVVGIDGDQKWVDHAIARVLPHLEDA